MRYEKVGRGWIFEPKPFSLTRFLNSVELPNILGSDAHYSKLVARYLSRALGNVYDAYLTIALNVFAALGVRCTSPQAL